MAIIEDTMTEEMKRLMEASRRANEQHGERRTSVLGETQAARSKSITGKGGVIGEEMEKSRSVLDYWKRPEFSFEHFDKENRFALQEPKRRRDKLWGAMTGKNKKVTFIDREDSDSKITYHERSARRLNFIPKITATKPTPNNIHQMLNLAEEQQWDSVRISGGSKEFKQEAWLQASLRGLKVEGYKPSKNEINKLNAMKADIEAMYEQYQQLPPNHPNRDQLLNMPPYVTPKGVMRLMQQQGKEVDPSLAVQTATLARGGNEKTQEAYRPQDQERVQHNHPVYPPPQSNQQEQQNEQEKPSQTQKQANTAEQSRDDDLARNAFKTGAFLAFMSEMEKMSNNSQSPRPHLMDQLKDLPPSWVEQIQDDLSGFKAIRDEMSQQEQGDMIAPLAEQVDRAYSEMAMDYAQAVANIYHQHKSAGLKIPKPPKLHPDRKEQIGNNFRGLQGRMAQAHEQIQDEFMEEKVADKMADKVNDNVKNDVKEKVDFKDVAKTVSSIVR